VSKRTWIDALFTGTILVLTGFWWYTTRPTDKRIYRYLVVSRDESLSDRNESHPA
jgi:hypothetical protein